MRFLTVSVLLGGLAAAGCDRGPRPVATRTDQSGARVANQATTAPATTVATGAASAPRAVLATEPAEAAGLGAPPARAASFVREVTVPQGTQLSIALDTAVGSDISRVEEAVVGHLTRPVVIRGDTVLPAGSRVTGVVTDATRAGKVKGRAHVAVRFDAINPAIGRSSRDESEYRIETAAVGRTAPSTKKKDAMKIGAPAAGGAIIGGLVGGKKGALIGGAIGGGGGAAVVMSTRGPDVHLPKGSALTVRLAKPVTVRVRV